MTDAPAPDVRLDIWLDVACLFKTRSEAQKACSGGKVEVNGRSSKPHRIVHIGDEIRVSRPLGRKQTLIVRVLSDRHVPRGQARGFYEDTTPPPSPDELAVRRIERAFHLGQPRSRPPGKRDRRELRKLKGR
jgi:ribosome-associated heat shock protein Hsp15